MRLLRRRLLAWFARHQRPLPWRESRDPYRIWVSEIMLQQTQVASAIPYYQRFLQRFPDLQALAAARVEEVLRIWEGLGYYRRARDLHAAARLASAAWSGTFSRRLADWLALPGIGRYTAGAILSQAFDTRVPILEANSTRVLVRILGCRGDPRTNGVKNGLWSVAEGLLPRRRAGDFNQALMELGALVCTPRNPDCPSCPVAAFCRARQLGIQDAIPAAEAGPARKRLREVAVVIRGRKGILLSRRPDEGRWGGLWEFPSAEIRRGEGPEQAGRRLLRERLGAAAGRFRELGRIRFGITRFDIQLICLEAEGGPIRRKNQHRQAARWVRQEELAEYPLSRPHRRLTRFI